MASATLPAPEKRHISKARFRAVGCKDDLVEPVVRSIEGQTVDGNLKVGERLPPERDPADRLAVSRTVLREAVRIMVTKGLLETRHGVGTTVREVTHEEVAAAPGGRASS